MKRIAALALVFVLIAASLCGCGSGKIHIFMYHNIVPDGEDCNSVTVTVSRMEEDLKWLTDNGYRTVLPSEICAGCRLDSKTVMITFDDGYLSNYLYLFPLLQKYNQKAVINVETAMISSLNPNFMSWEMLREMSDSGLVEIGSHTHNQHNPESDGIYIDGSQNGVQQRRGEEKEAFKARIREDLSTSKNLIEEKVGRAPVCFAYPFGAYDTGSRKIANRMFGVTLLTNGDGPVRMGKSAKMLKREGVSMARSLADIIGR